VVKMTKVDDLKLVHQFCFSLYACYKEIIKKYKPSLDKLNLTYTQYIVMIVLWNKKLGGKLFLDLQ